MRDLFKSLFLALTAGVLFGFTACVTDAGGKKDEGVTSVTLTATNNAKVKVGETITLTATPNATPAKAEYIWTTSSVAMGQINGSSDSPVTTEENTVSLKGIKEGTVTVTVTVDGVKSNTLTVTVEKADEVVTTPVLADVALSGSTSISATGTSTLTASPTFSTGTATPEYTWEIIQVNGTSASSTQFATLTGNGATATLTGNNNTTSEKTVTVQVTATYNGVSITASLTITIAAAQDTVTNKLTGLTLVAESASIHRGENSVLTAAATYSGTVSLTYNWAITAVDGTAVSSTEYASLSSTVGRDSRAVTTVNRFNTLTSANKTASNHTVTVTLTASDGTVTKTATATVTLIGDSVTGISVNSTETQISAAGRADFTATVNTSHESVQYEVTWAITAVDGTAVSSTEWASIVTNSDGSATLTGTNTDSASHVITVTATATNSNDSTNKESTTRTINILQDGVSAAYYPIQGTAEAYADTYLELEFDSAPTVNRASTGTVRIYKANGTLVDTIKPAAETMYGYGYSGNSGPGSINVQYQLIQVIGNKVRIIPHHNTSTGLTLLENSTSYYVLIDDGIITGNLEDSAFAGITETTGWTFTTGPAPSVSGNTITVGDGGNFITVQGAFSWMMANSKKGDWTIKIEPGTYYERIFYSGSANITMSGQGSAEYGTDVEIQWCNQDGGSSTTLWNYGSRGRNVFYYRGSDLVLENISIVNTATRKTDSYGEYDASGSDTANGNNQAEALLFDSTGNCAAYNCNFTSKQDTILLNSGRAWFYKSHIEGDVDFIWGSATAALFEECEIESILTEKTAYLTETRVGTVGASTVGKGYVFLNSTIKGNGGSNATYLSRLASGNAKNNPTKTTYDQVAFINSTFDSSAKVDSDLWVATDSKYPRFIEKDSSGNVNVGWKTYGNTGITPVTTEYAGEITSSLYSMEYNGRYAILNRLYNVDYEAYQTNSSVWSLTSLEGEFSASTDASKNNAFTEPDTSTSTTIKWDFTAIASGTTYEGKTGTFAATAGTGTLYVDATSGKIATRGTDAQFNSGTIAYIPASVGDTISVTLYNGNYTLGTTTAAAATTEITVAAGDLTTYNGVSCVALTATGSEYLYLISVVPGNGGSWTWTATDYADGITEDKATISANSVLGNVTISGTGAIWRVSNSTPYCMETGKAANGCLKFTTSATATIAIVAASTGSSNKSDAILSTSTDTSGAIAEASGATTVTGSNPQTTLTYNNVAAGTYFFGAFPASSNSRGLRVYSITVTAGTASLSSVTISGNSSVLVGTSITLTATPDATPADSTYTWTLASGSDYVSLGSSTTNTVTVTGVSAGSATITATVDGVTSSAYTVTAVAAEDLVISDGSTIKDSDTTSRSGTLTITKGEKPTGYAGVGYSAPSYTTVTVTTAADLVNYAKTGGYFIIVDGMIDMTTRYDGSTMLPSKGGGTTTALDAFVNEKSGGAYSTYLEWQAAYAASCSLTTEDGSSGSGNSSLYSMLWTLNNAYKNIIQLNVAANTAIVGKDADSGIRGAAISISGVSNVVLRNLNLSDSCDPFPHHESGDGYNAQHDCICIQGNSSYIWIDHCTLEDTYTLAHVKTGGSDLEKWQTYDGLLDIKGTGANITVSYCKFKNHDKTSLIGSSDDEGSASKRLVTYHHNYFYNCGQRLPMVRNTTMHLYNNYYDASSPAYQQQYAVGVRNGSSIFAENNYFGRGIYYSFKDSGTASSSGILYASGNEDNSNKGTSLKRIVGATLFSTGPRAYAYSADTISAITDGTSGVPQTAGTGAVTIE